MIVINKFQCLSTSEAKSMSQKNSHGGRAVTSPEIGRPDQWLPVLHSRHKMFSAGVSQKMIIITGFAVY